MKKIALFIFVSLLSIPCTQVAKIQNPLVAAATSVTHEQEACGCTKQVVCCCPEGSECCKEGQCSKTISTDEKKSCCASSCCTPQSACCTKKKQICCCQAGCCKVKPNCPEMTNNN